MDENCRESRYLCNGMSSIKFPGGILGAIISLVYLHGTRRAARVVCEPPCQFNSRRHLFSLLRPKIPRVRITTYQYFNAEANFTNLYESFRGGAEHVQVVCRVCEDNLTIRQAQIFDL